MLLGEKNVAMVSDFGLSRDVYESGEYESTSGVYTVFSCLKNGKSSLNDKLLLIFYFMECMLKSVVPATSYCKDSTSFEVLRYTLTDRKNTLLFQTHLLYEVTRLK